MLVLLTRTLVLVCLGVLAAQCPAAAQETLPYTLRTKTLSGWRPTVHGDIRTVGMAGATLGLGDTFIAALDNPGGLAMTLRVGDISYSGDLSRDGQVQDFNAPIESRAVGVAVNFYPWAVSLGYRTPYGEDAYYLLKSSPDVAARLHVATHELVLSVARVFLDNRFSIGATLILGQAARDILFAHPGNVADQSFASYGVGGVLGVMVRLPVSLLLGASFSLPITYAEASPSLQRNPALPGFFQSVDVPWRAGVGLGFIPNRFLRADLSVYVLGATPNAALVRDEAALVGQQLSLEPRLGGAYVFADYRFLRGTLFAGSYLELARIAGADTRVHVTGGMEGKLWVFTGGFGLDVAADYRNYLFSFGVDVFDVMTRLGMIPASWSPPHEGLLPHRHFFSDEGLARPLVKDWKTRGPEVDPFKAAIGIPGKLGDALKNADDQLQHIDRTLKDAIDSDGDSSKAEGQPSDGHDDSPGGGAGGALQSPARDGRETGTH